MAGIQGDYAELTIHKYNYFPSCKIDAFAAFLSSQFYFRLFNLV